MKKKIRCSRHKIRLQTETFVWGETGGYLEPQLQILAWDSIQSSIRQSPVALIRIMIRTSIGDSHVEFI